jgi:hypothetical protein
MNDKPPPTLAPCPACDSPIAKADKAEDTIFFDPTCMLCDGLGLVELDVRNGYLRMTGRKGDQ